MLMPGVGSLSGFPVKRMGISTVFRWGRPSGRSGRGCGWCESQSFGAEPCERAGKPIGF